MSAGSPVSLSMRRMVGVPTTDRRGKLLQRTRPAVSERSGETGDGCLSDRAVGVERRVEDGDFEADRPAGCHGELDHRMELVPARATGQSLVHRRHDGVIQDVAVEVDPKAVELRSTQALEGVACGALGASLSHGREIDDGNGGVLDALAARPLRLLGIAPPEHRDILVTHHRPATVEYVAAALDRCATVGFVVEFEARTGRCQCICRWRGEPRQVGDRCAARSTRRTT